MLLGVPIPPNSSVPADVFKLQEQYAAMSDVLQHVFNDHMRILCTLVSSLTTHCSP